MSKHKQPRGIWTAQSAHCAVQHVLWPKQPQPGSGGVHPGLWVPLSSGDDHEDDHEDDCEDDDENDHQDEDFNAYSSEHSAASSTRSKASVNVPALVVLQFYTENICHKHILNNMTQLVFRTAILKKYLFFKVYFRRTSGRSQQSGILCVNEPSLRLSSPPPTSAGSWW